MPLSSACGFSSPPDSLAISSPSSHISSLSFSTFAAALRMTSVKSDMVPVDSSFMMSVVKGQLHTAHVVHFFAFCQPPESPSSNRVSWSATSRLERSPRDIRRVDITPPYSTKCCLSGIVKLKLFSQYAGIHRVEKLYTAKPFYAC